MHYRHHIIPGVNPGYDTIVPPGRRILRFLTTTAGHWTIMSFGIILRIAQFLYNRSLTEGEAPLALNIIERSFSQLAKPLDYVQVAPVGFLVFQKAIVIVLGTSEHALRLIPLCAGILALICFYYLVQKTLERSAIPFALILFACCDHLIYFASEIKQYSTDVLCSLLLVIITINAIDSEKKRFHIILFACAGAMTFWFSHPSFLTYVAGAIILAWLLLKEKEWSTLTWFALAQAIAIVSCVIVYSVSFKDTSQNQAMLSFWQPSFMPIPPRSLVEVLWLPHVLLRMFTFPGGFSRYELLLAVVAYLSGLVVLLRKHGLFPLLFLLPIMMTLLASAFHVYPFEGRLLLFLTPALLLPVAAGINHITRITREKSPALAAALIGVLLAYPVGNACYRLIKPRAPEELRPVMEYVDEHFQEDDQIYVYYAAINAYEYYKGRFSWTSPYQAGIEARSHWELYLEDLENLRGRKRVWVLLSHIATHQGVNEEQLFITYLDMLGTRLDAFIASGAAGYLYDLDTLTSE